MKRIVPFQVSSEDRELFRKTVGAVKPLQTDRIVHTPKRRPGNEARH